MGKLKEYILRNARGDFATILNFGATLKRWQINLNNELRDLVLSYPGNHDYLDNPAYLGSIVGPVANRISGKPVTINSKAIKLIANEGNNQLHGGPKGFSHHYWQCIEQQTNTVRLSLHWIDGCNGYPGPIKCEVIYQLFDDGSLSLIIEAKSSKDTFLGPTGHAYFNLNRQSALQNTDESQLWHHLHINASNFTQVDNEKIPTGKIMPVDGIGISDTGFTLLTRSTPILDHNFEIKPPEEKSLDHPQNLACCAKLQSMTKDIELSVLTDYPGVQVYTADYLAEPFVPRSAVCIEPQYFPDSPHHRQFESCLLRANQSFRKVIIYNISTKQS